MAFAAARPGKEVNVGKLKRVAIKEFTRSPAKTGFLVLMLPVALYFCVPLLFGSQKKSTAAATDPAKPADFVLPAAVDKVASVETAQDSWVEVARWLADDRLAVPAPIGADARNPFVVAIPIESEQTIVAATDDEQVRSADIETQVMEIVEEEVTTSNPIRELGLQLNATMVGRRARLATINGKTYERGETITVIIEGGAVPDLEAELQLELAHIERSFIVLRMDEHQHRLYLPNELPKDAIVVKPRSN